MVSNIQLWEQVISAPTQAYRDMLQFQHDFLVASIPSGAEVLDAGCGEGRNIRAILERTAKVTGLDSDAVAVEHATSNLREFHQVKVVNADAASMPLMSA